MRQQQEHDELHQRTIAALRKVSDFLSTDDLALLCWHCGIKPEEVAAFYEPPRKAA